MFQPDHEYRLPSISTLEHHKQNRTTLFGAIPL
jgi:hypothetical protein